MENNEEKFKRIKQKLDSVLVEISAEMLDPETEKAIKEETERIFKVSGIPFSKITLKAYSEGISMCLYLLHKTGGNMVEPTMVMSIARKLVADIESRTKKQVDSLEEEKQK